MRLGGAVSSSSPARDIAQEAAFDVPQWARSKFSEPQPRETAAMGTFVLGHKDWLREPYEGKYTR
jgi:hypothetical protein